MSGPRRNALGLQRFALPALLVALASPALADPDCKADTFTGERSCIYGRGTIGLPGIGNQIITSEGKMFFRRLVSQIGGQPVETEAILFRVDDRRTIMLPAVNDSKPGVNCTGRLCTWSWTVSAPISPDALAELASAKKLIIGFRGEGMTIQEQPYKKGGRIFEKFLADVREHEPELLETATAEVLLLEGREVKPYSAAETTL